MIRGFSLGTLTSLLAATFGFVAAPAQAIDPFADWKNVSAGEKHTCGVRANGKLYCWGENSLYQLGHGPEADDRSAPTRVGTKMDWSSASAGSNHSCGIRNDGELFCWGYNNKGQVGDGSVSTRDTPVRVGTSKIWASVSAGEEYTCGVKTNGNLYCWGQNGSGQLGIGSMDTQKKVPTRVGSATDWRSVAAGRYRHACGIRGKGDLYCWGWNTYGQTGDGTVTTPRRAPVRVGEFGDWLAVSPGSSHTCGVRKNGKLYCWGQNGYAQLGIGSSSQRELALQRVGTFQDWVGVGAGYAHSCGVRANGKLYCWGKNDEGQVGNGSDLSPWMTPTRAGSDLGWTRIASGDNHNCAIRNGGELFCWGDNGSGRVGNPTATNPQRSPIRI